MSKFGFPNLAVEFGFSYKSLFNKIFILRIYGALLSLCKRTHTRSAMTDSLKGDSCV